MNIVIDYIKKVKQDILDVTVKLDTYVHSSYLDNINDDLKFIVQCVDAFIDGYEQNHKPFLLNDDSKANAKLDYKKDNAVKKFSNIVSLIK